MFLFPLRAVLQCPGESLMRSSPSRAAAHYGLELDVYCHPLEFR